MGSERAVTRWCLRQQTILYEIATLEAELETTFVQPLEQGSGLVGELRPSDDHAARIEQQLRTAQEKLYRLGPCPKPMMG